MANMKKETKSFVDEVNEMLEEKDWDGLAALAEILAQKGQEMEAAEIVSRIPSRERRLRNLYFFDR